MTDAKFNVLLAQCGRAHNRARQLYKKAEAEYERRYGVNPSDVSDDNWLDSIAGACGDCRVNFTAEEVDFGARAIGLFISNRVKRS